MYGLLIFIFLLNLQCALASPTISWSGVQDIELGAQSSTGRGILDLDFDNNGAIDYNFEYGVDSTLWVRPQNGNEIIMTDIFSVPPLYDLHSEHLEAGAIIENGTGEHLSWELDDDILAGTLGGASGGVFGYWKGADHEYMGVRFTAADGIHYGWIEMSVSDTYELATIHSWAYNTVPGEGLVAGVVPEPSTIALFLVGIAAFGIKRMRQ